MQYSVRTKVGPIPMMQNFETGKLPVFHCQASSPLHAALKAAASEIEARAELKLAEKTSVMHAFVHYEDLGRHKNGMPLKIHYIKLNIGEGLEADAA